MSVGAFGLGSSAISLIEQNLNDKRATGFYYCSSPTNGPGHNGWLLHEDISDAGYAAQTYKALNGRVFQRVQNAGVWATWVELYHSGNLLNIGATAATARTALGLVKGTSPGNVLVAGEGLVGRHTVECFAFMDGGITTGTTIYTNIPADTIMPNLIIRGALNGYTEPFEARLSWYFYHGAVYMPNVLITATGGVSGMRFYLRPENGKIVIRIDFGSNVYFPRLAFDALLASDWLNPSPAELQGWSAVSGNVVGSGEVEAARSRTYHSRNILGTVSQSAGIPTGAIIERGSNANGSYVKFADGTLICTNRVVINRVTPPGVKQNNLLTPAATFVGQPAIYKNLEYYNGLDGTLDYLYTFSTTLGRFVNSGESSAYEFSWPPTIGTHTANSEVHTLYAIGRWY